MNIWRERIYNFNFLSLCLLACFPVISMKMTVILIIIFTGVSVISGFIWNTKKLEASRLKELLILTFPFLLIFLRTIIFDRSPEASFYFEVSLSLVAFPIAFFFLPLVIDTKKRSVLNTLFILSTFSIVFYGLIKVAIKFLNNLGPDKFWKTSDQMFGDPSFAFLVRTVFETAVKIHPTYASIFLGISVLLLLDKFLVNFKTLSRKGKFLFYFAISIALLLQGILASRTPFIATMFAALVLFFAHLPKKIYALYVIAGMAIITISLVLIVPSFSSRFKEISLSNTSLPTEEHENSFNIRTGIYKCSMEIISNHWLLGVGPGNVQPMLNKCYNEISREVYENKNYNTHNTNIQISTSLVHLHVAYPRNRSGHSINGTCLC